MQCLSQQRQLIQRHYTMSNASDTGNAAILYDMTQATHGRGTSLRNLFLAGGATPLPPSPMHPSAPAPNAETPLPRKTRFLCNAYLYPPPIKTPFFTYTHLYLPMLPCSYADLCFACVIGNDNYSHE